MRPAQIAFVITLAAAATWLASSAFTQEKGSSIEEGMKRWQEANTPGPKHKDLARFLGSWDTETSVWMEPGAAPMKSKGTSEVRWLVEGRWLSGESKGQFMGMPISMFDTFGYDNFKQKYVGSHVDSMGTTMLAYEGNYDQTGNVLITWGLMDEPMTGENDKMCKYVWRFEGKDKYTFEVHDMAIGETNTKVFEILHTRKK